MGSCFDFFRSKYLGCGGLDHGCALTVHQAQGLTCQRAMLLGSDALNRKAGYVGLRDRALMLLACTAALGSPRPGAVRPRAIVVFN